MLEMEWEEVKLIKPHPSRFHSLLFPFLDLILQFFFKLLFKREEKSLV